MKVGRHELKRRVSDIIRKGLTDSLMQLLIDSLWRDPDEIVRIVNVSINNNTTNIYNTIRGIITQQAENNHESFLIENTESTTVTQESSWSVNPFDQQVGEFKAVVMIHNKATNTIITLMSLLSFDYSDTPPASLQSDLITGSATLTVSVSTGNKLQAVVTGMAGDNKRIHFCFERCVLGMRASDMEANGLFELHGVGNLVLAEFVDITASGSLELDGTANIDQLIDIIASGELELNGVAEITDEEPVTEGLKLTFDDIANVPVANPASVNDWNTFFDLPAKGTEFTSVVVSGNEVTLVGSDLIVLKYSIFDSNSNLLSFEDTIGVIHEVEWACFNNCQNLTSIILPAMTTAGDQAFGMLRSIPNIYFPLLETAGVNCFMGIWEENTNIVSINLPSLITAGDTCFEFLHSVQEVILPKLENIGAYCFADCYAILEFNLPSAINFGTACFQYCTSVTSFNLSSASPYLGEDALDNYLFFNISGNDITLTVPAALMTCNGGNPDGDIQYLQENNTVTVITI